jgi:hypothetical protein
MAKHHVQIQLFDMTTDDVARLVSQCGEAVPFRNEEARFSIGAWVQREARMTELSPFQEPYDSDDYWSSKQYRVYQNPSQRRAR